MGEQRSLFYILKNFFKKDIQGHNSRESKETSGGFVKTWQILPKTKCKSLLPSFTKSYQIVTFTASHNFSSRKCVLLVGVYTQYYKILKKVQS